MVLQVLESLCAGDDVMRPNKIIESASVCILQTVLRNEVKSIVNIETRYIIKSNLDFEV